LLAAELHEMNRTATDYPRESTIAQLFEQQVARTPDALAVVSGDRRLAYRELDSAANRLARYLEAQGVGTETLVGVAIERSADMVVALLAILKAGAAYVPMDPGYPQERIALLMEDSGIGVILTTERTRNRIPTTDARIVSLDGEAQVIANQSSDRVPCSASGRNLAYVIYTSGSTGRPKGVMVEQRNVVNFFTGMDLAIGAEPGVWLAVTSISFDISVLELLWTLTRGFEVVIHGDEGTHTIAGEILRYGVTHLQSTPSLARMLAMDEGSLAALGRVQQLLLGGEALPASLVSQIRKAFRGDMHNMYGPTETTIWSTSHRIVDHANNIPIGRPIANTQVYVLDSALQPVPVGEPGDLFIAGDGVVRGYWRRPELTAERFLPDPFRPGNRMYRTGDVARVRADGNLEFLGRSDFQVKLRGFRIELGEIESILEQQSSVHQAVVAAREEKAGDKRLIAYVVCRAGEITTASSLRSAIAAKLPEYMVPSSFVFLESLPLTANGKIDRNGLPAPRQETESIEASDEQPRNEIEQAIAQVWKETLGVERISLNDNFFDLGAHSLMVAEVHVQMQQILDRQISLVDLFQFPTVSSLASHLGGQTAAPRTSDRAQRRLSARKTRVTQ
jgi:amino acid adenylation domain-containing protein